MNTWNGGFFWWWWIIIIILIFGCCGNFGGTGCDFKD